MQRLIYALLGVTALSAAALLLALFNRKNPAPQSVPAPAAVARAACPDAARPPSPLLPELSAAPLVVVPGTVSLRVDGAPAPAALTEGPHVLEASAEGATPSRLQVQVPAFSPVLVDARVVGSSVVVVLLGVRCATCPHAETDVDLQYRRGGIGDLTGVARALGQGDWPLAAQQVRAVPAADFSGPTAALLRAALFGLAGRPSLARAELALLPKRDPIHAALTRWERADATTARRQLETATARWNAVTERLQRLTDRFADEAPETMTALTVSFEALAPRVVKAQAKEEVIEVEALLEEATLALTKAMGALRARRPEDCDWQARITASE